MGYLKYNKSSTKLLEAIRNASTIDELENVLHRQYNDDTNHKFAQNVNHILTYQSFYNLIDQKVVALTPDDTDIVSYFHRINSQLMQLVTM